MVKLSKFFGKENEDEHGKSRKNGPPADPGLPADVRQQPVEPDQKTILPKQESSQQVLSSWVEHKDIEEIYDNAIWVFKRF